MLQFSWFAFLSTFRLSNQTSKIARILTLYQANAATFTPLSKEDKILITSLQECKGYNARQFITEFMNRGWTKTASTGCGWSSEQSTGVWAAADAVRNWWKRRHSWVAVAESGRQTSEPREISREVGDPSIICFADYSQTSASQVLQEKACSTAVWSAQHARVIFGMQFERQ